MEIASCIISPITECLMAPIKEHLGYVISSTKYVSDMDRKMRYLDGRRNSVEDIVELNKINNLQIPNQVPDWLEEVGRIQEEVKHIPSDFNNCLDLKMRYKVGRKAFEMIQEIEHLITENSRIEWTDRPIPLGKVDSTKASTSAPSSHYNDFKSRESTFEEALKALQPDHDTHMIALCGMGGVGKTTMMEKLKTAVAEKKVFDYIAKAVIGEQMNPIQVQDAVADYLKIDLNERAKEARAEKLGKSFKAYSDQGKKILVILDNVWELFDLNDIIDLSTMPNQCVGIKFLITARDQNVCAMMGVKADSIFKVKFINDPEAQSFFRQIAEISEDADPDLKKIGENIVRRCGGLPIAIKTIASTLNGKGKDLWEDALHRLENADLDDLEGIVHRIFETSYDNLKNEEAKAIFLLCGLFRDDFDIPTEDLMRYGFGLKLFHKVKHLRETRRRLSTCVVRLIQSNLLIESDRVGCVKMHDLVRSFVLGIFSKNEHASIVNHGNTSEWLWPTEDTNMSYQRISLVCTHIFEFPRDFKYQNLTLLKLMHGKMSLRFPEDFYERMEKLEIIAYERMMYLLLPRSLHCSTNLRALCLHSCSLMDELYHIGDLVSLEILSFAYCGIRKLPYTIGNLKQLKLLDLTGCIDLVINDGVLGNLIHLEELYIKASHGKDIRFTDANFRELEKLLRNLYALEVEFFLNKPEPKNLFPKNLERFRISIGCHLKRRYFQDYSFQNALALVINKGDLLESRINELFGNTEVLHLKVDGMNYLEEVVVESPHPPRQWLLNTLRELKLWECADLRYLFTLPVVRSLSKLEHLTISLCSVLEEMIHVETIGSESIRFQNLKFLSLKGLPELVSLCRNANLVELPELKELTLEGLPNFTSVYPQNDISAMQSVLNKVAIPKLEILKIKQMAKLKEMCPCQFRSCEDENICRLREIEVEGCDSLVNLFPTNPMSWLHHLEKVVIRDCGSIEVIFDLDLGCVHEIVEGSSSLRRIDITSSGKLREVWRTKGVNDTHHINGFQAVTHIKISSCESFRNVFTPTTANFDLGALEYININGCESLGENGRKNGSMESSTNTPCLEINVASMGETSGGVDDDNVAFPSHLIPTFHHVGEIYLNRWKGMEVVFEMESPSSIGGRELGTTHNNKVLLPHLKVLTLWYMERMSHVWKCNWNKFLIPQPLEPPFHNLTNIDLRSCERIEYLFSPLMARLLSNLKVVQIFYCDVMEEVVSNRDDEDEEMPISTFTHTNGAFFPQLDILWLNNLPSLKHIGGGRVGGWSNEITSNINAIGTSIHNEFQVAQARVVSWSLCQYTRKIRIWNCDALTSVIPSHAIGPLKKLEELQISKCKSMVEVFGTERVNNDSIYFDERSCGSSTAVTIPRLKNMTMLELPNLKILKIELCNNLGHIFTYSTLESLKQLEELKIKDCEAMQVIVKEEVGEQPTPKVVDFPRLKSLELVNLPNLNGFFLGMNDFKWPLLDMVKIVGCPQMMVFTRGHSTTPNLKYIHTILGKHSLECGLNFHMTTPNASQETYFHNLSACTTLDKIELPWSFSNLIEVDVQDFGELLKSRIIFPCNELLKLQNLEKLRVMKSSWSSSWSSSSLVEEVFEVVDGTNDDVNETQCVVIFPKLKEVTLIGLQNLRYIWKSNQRTLLEFPNLTRVSISSCRRLDHLFTWSMVGSLQQLQELHISYCQKMKVIVKEAKVVQEEEEETDAKTNEIVFPCLKSLKFEELPSLKGFCLENGDFLWPSLDTLEIKGCRQITVFTNGESTTPKLKVIDTSFGRFYAKEDLNSFIKTKTQEVHVVSQLFKV